jgi:hypothetical protein
VKRAFTAAAANPNAKRVNSFVRQRDGTYVQSHARTLPDPKVRNNFSFPGSYNPNTGRNRNKYRP